MYSYFLIREREKKAGGRGVEFASGLIRPRESDIDESWCATGQAHYPAIRVVGSPGSGRV